MSTSRLIRTTALATAIGLACSTGIPGETAEAVGPEDVARFNVRIEDPWFAGRVRTAVKNAHRRLQGEKCREIFTEFHDPSGRRLKDTLEDLGDTGDQYLRRILFYDGSTQKACATATNMALTMRGSRVVFLCPRFGGEHPRHAEAIIIHEALHSLGLGENPPSSSHITSRVLSRCSG